LRERERERERGKKKTMQLSIGPTFWGMLTKCYFLWTSQVCKCEFIFWGHSQNTSYFNWCSIELANKEERRRTPHCTMMMSRPLFLWFLFYSGLAAWRPRLLCCCVRKRDTHTCARHLLWPLADAKKQITVLRSWVLLKFESHDECAFWECQVCI
jgi:hypothetical protein